MCPKITNFPEMMDGRVKTLHPNVHGGLLALRDKSDHACSRMTDARHRGHRPAGLQSLSLSKPRVARGADFGNHDREYRYRRSRHDPLRRREP